MLFRIGYYERVPRRHNEVISYLTKKLHNLVAHTLSPPTNRREHDVFHPHKIPTGRQIGPNVSYLAYRNLARQAYPSTAAVPDGCGWR